MLRHEFLYDPIEKTADMKVEEFTKYTDINKSHNGRTDEDTIKEIKTEYFKFVANQMCTQEEQDHANEIWDFVSKKLEQNPGLAAFTLDYKGAESLYFFPWLKNVFLSPSAALEMAYGFGEDIYGNWNDDTLDDPIDFFIRNDPTFVYNRERQLYLADLATTIYDKAWYRSDGVPSKIVDFGAGHLAWARWGGFGFDPRYIQIYAYDKDPKIDPKEFFTDDPKDLGVHFEHGDLMEHVNDPAASGADLVILGGVVSYIPKTIFSQAVMMPIYHLLIPGGVFFFDLQIDCPYLRRSMSIFDWPKMYLTDDVPTAIKEIEALRSEFWQKGLKFSVEYAVDTYNASPSAVMVTMQKL